MITLNCEHLEQKHFPDGTLNLKTPVIDPGVRVSIKWNYDSDAELFTIICLAKKYHNNPKVLYLPYVPHARMDRVKNPETEVFTLKYFCETINSLGFERVIVHDAHSNVAPALLDNCINMSVMDKIDVAVNRTAEQVGFNNLVLFFPDEGAMKRYSSDVRMPYTFGVKCRDWETGTITSLSLAGDVDVKGKDILIIDDICSYGGTFVHAAKALRANGANKIFLYVTHCEHNILNGGIFNEENKGLFTGIYTLGTLPALPEIYEDMTSVVRAEAIGPWIEFI